MNSYKTLTPEKFEQFLQWLDPDSEAAGAEYERLRYRLTRYFAHRNSLFSEELADETIDRVIGKIEIEEIENKTAYCYGVAKFVFLESLRNERAHENIDDLQIEAVEPLEEEETVNPCFEECIDKLEKDRRTLLLEYFSESKQAKIDLHARMSKRLSISKTALRMKILRIKKQLKACMQECLTV